jgi:hypothetical protein
MPEFSERLKKAKNENASMSRPPYETPEELTVRVLDAPPALADPAGGSRST